MKERRKVSATYRLQLTRKFTFKDAESLVPYLRRLGISHIYASPIFAACPGSISGYDTCDFSRINPELGGDEGFASLVQALHRHSMGLVVDFVPNHMSAHPQWNLWWRNVLAHGPSSPDSEYFDIDWYPANSNLHGKVLLPILGEQYGDVLESGEFRIDYRNGEFCLLYADYNLPLNPRQIKLLLRHRLSSIREQPGIDFATLQEFESILFLLDHIPGYLQAGSEARADRERETHIATRRLITLIHESSALRKHLDRVIKEFNGQPGKPESFDLLHELLEQQPYRLSYWRTAMQEINYRRFFDINDLIGIRMEYEPLFQAAHRRLVELTEQGMIDGIRLDHIDGLLDPQQYLVQLRNATEKAARPLYLIVEKILARQEWLSPDWPVDGATGYEYLALVNGLWVREENLRRIEAIYREFREQSEPERDVVYHAKRLITSTSMASELNVLAHELNSLSEQNRSSRDNTLDGLQEALREVVACFPVYRTYISRKGSSAADEMAVNEAIGQAKRRNPNIGSSFFEFIRDHIYPVRQSDETEKSFAQRVRFAMKFQQYTSPVQAKGMEDTVFYRHSPLASLNEVGSGTGRRATTPKEFHDANIHRMEKWPDAMLTTSTHDTKHGEDARLRIHVLTESPEEWRAKLAEWSRINECAKTQVNGQIAPDPADEYLYYQNLIGMWPPLQREATDEIVERMAAFMNKALKEAKVHTSWINPSNDYDAAMEKFVRETLRGDCTAEFVKSFVSFAERIARFGAWNSISQIALKMASPGVIDTYQGGELWDLSLVDPDNRRPVDYELRSKKLAQLIHAFDRAKDSTARLNFISEHCARWWTGDLKLLYLALGLRLREQEPELLARGRYLPLAVHGPAAQHIVAFARVHGEKVLITAAARWFVGLVSESASLAGLQEKLRDTFVELPPDADDLSHGGLDFRNMINGSQCHVSDEHETRQLSTADLLNGLPAAWALTIPDSVR